MSKDLNEWGTSVTLNEMMAEFIEQFSDSVFSKFTPANIEYFHKRGDQWRKYDCDTDYSCIDQFQDEASKLLNEFSQVFMNRAEEAMQEVISESNRLEDFDPRYNEDMANV